MSLSGIFEMTDVAAHFRLFFLREERIKSLCGRCDEKVIMAKAAAKQVPPGEPTASHVETFILLQRELASYPLTSKRPAKMDLVAERPEMDHGIQVFRYFSNIGQNCRFGTGHAIFTQEYILRTTLRVSGK